jgi:hypothetical protein
MATTRKIGKELENLLEEHGEKVTVSTGFKDSRFQVSAERSSEGITYLAGGPSKLYLQLHLEKVKGHWKSTDLYPTQRHKLLVNRMLNTSYKVLYDSLNSLNDN